MNIFFYIGVGNFVYFFNMVECIFVRLGLGCLWNGWMKKFMGEEVLKGIKSSFF